jgi:peroxiredoxin
MTVIEMLEASPARAGLRMGDRAPGFDGLVGTDRERYGFPRFADKAALVLIFSSNRCPTAKAYATRMNELQRDYGRRGVQLLAINSNDPHLYPDEDLSRMVERADDDGYAFPYVVDEGQRVARAYGAECTFHVFVLDQGRRLRYRGRFDDARLPERVTTHDLRDALDDVLAGREVRRPETRAFGCSLDLV